MLFVEMDERFGVTVRFEAVPAFFQACAQLEVIIDLAVEDDVNRSVFVRDRLVAAGQINDAEPPNRQTNAGLDEVAFVIRPAVPQRLRHLLKKRPTISSVFRSDVTSNPTHEVPFSLGRSDGKLNDAEMGLLANAATRVKLFILQEKMGAHWFRLIV